MRADLMVWVQRLVGLVFVTGLVALVAVVVMLVRQAEGVPPMPIFMGLLGTVALILLAGACMGLISLAISARRGADALGRIAAPGHAAPAVAAPVSAAQPQRPFSAAPLQQAQPETAEPEDQPQVSGPVAPPRPARPAGRRLVAER